MEKDMYELKKIVYNLESGYFEGREIELLDKLIYTAEKIKEKHIKAEKDLSFNENIELDKISCETFLYKPVMTRNYYEGDYLERFGESRTYDLNSSKLLEIHNEFWKAYEVRKGNIFASIPKELASKDQINRLETLGWDKVEVDVYEVTKCNTTKKELIKYVEKLFSHHVVVLEVYSNTNIILSYNIK